MTFLFISLSFHRSFRFLDRFHLSSFSLLSEGAVSILDKDPDHCLESRDHLLSVVEAVTSSKDPLASLLFQPSPAARTSVHVTLLGRLSGYSTLLEGLPQASGGKEAP